MVQIALVSTYKSNREHEILQLKKREGGRNKKKKKWDIPNSVLSRRDGNNTSSASEGNSWFDTNYLV